MERASYQTSAQQSGFSQPAAPRFSLFCTAAPLVAPTLLLRALPDEPAVLWQPPHKLLS